jgi:hypothetical protein
MKHLFSAGCVFLAVLTCALGVPPDLYSQDREQVEGTGWVVGRVIVEGRYDMLPPLKVNKNRDFCGNEVLNESLLVGPDGSVQNVIVTIRGLRRDSKRQPTEIVLHNKDCLFVPHVQVAALGSEVLLLNSDPILHNVHARLGRETLFNVGLPQWRTVRKRLEREGLIRIHCDVLHTWMSAYILVTSSPYFAVTNQKGEFAIDGIPAGTHDLEFWHEKLGVRQQRVTVFGSGVMRADLIYRVGNREASPQTR